MIRLVLLNNVVYIWNPEDWYTARRDHRLALRLTGCLPRWPRQLRERGLPVWLAPQEVTLLLELGVAKLLGPPPPSHLPDSELSRTFQTYTLRINKEQEEEYLMERRREVTSLVERIAEGKRRKEGRRGGTAAHLDTEEIVRREMERALPPSNHLAQTHLEDPWYRTEDEAEWKYPQSNAERLEYSVFKELWEQGGYLTAGTKFGGTYLLYPGDPVRFHAQAIVECVEEEKEIELSQLVSHSRLATTTNKTFVIATLLGSEPRPTYISVQFSHRKAW